MAENNAPKAAVFHLPGRTFREPRLGLFDGIRERVDVRRERRGRRRVYARDVVVRACLRNERAGKKNGGDRQWGGTRQERRGSRVVLALTSRWPARPVLLTIWQRSGGPSSRNVAGNVRPDEMDVRRGRGEQPEGLERGVWRENWGNVRTKGLGSCQEGLPQLDLLRFFF